MKFFILLTICVVSTLAEDYCRSELCPNGGPHIACKNSGELQCSNAEVVNMNNFKDKILDKHNTYRNKIASGNQSPYKSAARMAKITWDEELARLAEFNVKQCQMEHDRCHNTNQFKYSGQNLAYWSGTSDPGVESILDSALDGWYNEYENADNSVIEKFRSSTGKQYGHFTAMVADRNFKCGCATVKVKKDGWTTYYTACNYAFTNMLGEPIYEFGAPASKCKTGKDSKYTALCSVQEKYDV